MNFDFSDDQRLLQQEVRRMLDDTCTSVEVRKSLEGESPYSKSVWRELVGMGAAATAIPEEYGGSGFGYLELCLVAEELGRHLAAVPVSSSFYLAAETLVLGGNQSQKQQWLPQIASGEVIATANLGGSEGYLDDVTRVVDGDKLTGIFVLPDAAVADVAILRVDNDILIADLKAPGVTRRAIPSLDPTRPYGEVCFESANIDVLAGGSFSGALLAARVLNGAAVLVAFEQLGGADQVLHITKEYSLERTAFGRQIGSFQALKHKMADIYTANELARVHAYYGAWALSSGAPELALAAAAARTSATVAYNRAAEESIEIHGGIGFTWEMDCHMYMRRSRYLGQLIGSEHCWRAQLADELIGEAA